MFGFGKKRFLGIDMATSSIKMVEIEIRNNKPVLSNYAWVSSDDTKNGGTHSSFLNANAFVCLKKTLEEGKFDSKNVYVSIPAFGGLIMLIEFPEMTDLDLAQAIKFEAHKYIPASLEDVILSWDVVNRPVANRLEKTKSSLPVAANAEPSKIQVLLVAAPRNKIVAYEKVIKELGLKLKNMEIESFSLARSLVGNDQGNFIIVDIGSKFCNIVLVEKGIIKVNRNVEAGGRSITQTISKGMNIDLERAEKLKLSGNGILNKESNMTFSVLDIIVGEIKRVLSAYYKNESKIKIDSVILSGGTSNLKGISEYFSSALNMKVINGNPLSRIEYDSRLEPKLNTIKSQFAVAIGLAMEGVDECLKNNFNK